MGILPCHAGDLDGSRQPDPPSASPVENYFSDWFARVSKIQAEQPHWITPLVTVTPRLEQELRYDQSWETLPGGQTLKNYGGGKGLELIPAEPIELILGVPAWESENTSPRKQGWADESFLLKYRLLSANEEEGDYILTAFMGLSVPTGSADYTTHHYVSRRPSPSAKAGAISISKALSACPCLTTAARRPARERLYC